MTRVRQLAPFWGLLVMLATQPGCEDEAPTGGADAALGDVVGATDTGAALDTGAPLDTGGGTDSSAKLDVASCDCDPSKDTPCTYERCVAATGTCETTPRPKGTLCDDGDPCTVSATCQAGVCTPGSLSFCGCVTSADCTAKEDGNLCNGTLFCDKDQFPWSCRVNPATVVTCKGEGGPCASETCNPKTGSCATQTQPDATPCDDGDACTKNEACKGGVCEAKVNVCTCASDADCALVDDDNLCNGTLYCDTQHKGGDGKVAPKCKVNPATVVSCPDGNDTACAKAACQPKTGQCELVPTAGGTACDDGDKCTTGDACFIGKCVPGTNTCVCKSDAECEAKNGDGDLCNGTLFCNKVNGLCQVNPATVKVCPDTNDTACAQNTCKTLYETKAGKQVPKEAACTLVPVTDKSLTPCDDGDPCTKGDLCKGGKCAAGTYTCYCKSDKDCAGEEDGDQCNGTLFCNKLLGKCELNPATVVTCPSAGDNACRKNVCVKATGQCKMDTATYEGAACDDKSVCTKSDFCAAGSCVSGTYTCACKTDSDCVDVDGNKCNGVPYCDTSGALPVCKPNPASVVVCPKGDDSACIKNTCDPKTGACFLAELATQTGCDDGDACTSSDVCKGGECSGTNVCECQSDSDCLSKDDGDKCNGVPYCDTSTPGKHVCKPNPASVVVCPTAGDSACIKNTCDKKVGACYLAKLADKTLCDDGDKCTANDTCGNGKCVGGTFTCTCQSDSDCLAQDDGDLCNGVPYCDKSVPGKYACKPNPSSKVHCPQTANTQCLVNACNAKSGKCGLQPVTKGKACDDDNPCTAQDSCDSGACVGPVKADCADNDACTIDLCDKKLGCVHKQQNCADGNSCTVDKCHPKTGQCDFATVLGDGTACNADNDGCTVNDTCSKGVCKVGSTIKCTIVTKHCEKAVCKSEGQTAYKCLVVGDVDGAPCDDGASCTIGSLCKDGSCQPGKDKRLWTWSQGKTGEAYELNAADGSGGSAVVGGARHVLNQGAVSAAYAWVQALGKSGKPLWSFSHKATTPSDAVRVWTVHPLDAGGTLATGTTTVAGKPAVLFVRLDKAGKSVALREHGKWSGVEGRASALMPDKGAVVVGSAVDQGVTRVPWMRLSSSGHLSAAKLLPGLAGDVADAVDHTGANQTVVAGQSGKMAGDVRRGLLARVGATGAVLWRKNLAPNKASTDARLRAVVAQPSARLTAAGHTTDGSGTHYWLLRTDLQGKVLWQRVSPGAAAIHGMYLHGSGQLMVSGSAPDGSGGLDAWAMLTDPIGNPVWQQNFTQIDGAGAGSKPSVVLRGVHAMDGGLLLAGTRTAALQRAFVSRMSPWGQQTCESAGACATIAAAGCDDSDPCTLDRCDPKSGKCLHTTLEGLVCDPKDGCAVQGVCAAGKCKADPNGELWSRLYPWETGTEAWRVHAGVGAIRGTSDGGSVVFGHQQASQYAKYPYNGSLATVRRLDHTGSLVWQRKLTSPDPHSFKGTNKWLLERKNGEIWAGYQQQTSANGYGRSSFIVRTDVNGTALSTLNWKQKVGSTEGGIQAIAEAADGSLGYAIRYRFFRRNTSYAVVASKDFPAVGGAAAWPSRMAAASDGRWVAVGSGGGRGFATLLAPDGTAQWVVSPPGLTGITLRAARVDSGNDVRAAGWTTSTTAKRRLVVVGFAGKSGALQSVVTTAELNAGATVLAATGPQDGLAFVAKWGAGVNHKVRLFLTQPGGQPLLSRDLDAGNVASTWALGAGDDGVLIGGWAIAQDGKRKTTVARTGPWGLAPCTAAGLCKGVDPSDCDDKNACTTDSCAPGAGCTHTARSCDDGNACTTDACDKVKGCTHAPVVCDDKRSCTHNLCNVTAGGGEKAGCTFPLKPVCNDGSACTTDTCEADSSCKHTKVDCDDKSACTVDTCDKSAGCKHKSVTCNDHQPCTLDTCNKVKGCVFTALADGAVCKDGEVCVPLGPGICGGGACKVGGKAYVGCTSLSPASSCVAAKDAAGGKLDTFVGWTWLDEDKDGKNPKREWCDMKAGGFKRLYTNGVTRATNSWGPGSVMSCSGGLGQAKMWNPPAISLKYGSGTKTVTLNGALDVPQAHTAVRVRFRYHITTPNSTYKNWASAKIHLNGTLMFNGGLGGLPVVTGSSNPKAAGTCSPALGNMHALLADYQVAHTGPSVALSVQSTGMASTIWYAWPIGAVEVWVK